VPPALHGWNDNAAAHLDFNWELDFWGRTRAAVAAATSEAAAARADVAAARLMISTSIAAAYASLASLQADRQALASSLNVREQTLALVRRRVASGYDSNAELRQAEAGPPEVRADLRAVDEQIALGRLRLATLMGQPPDRAAAIAPPGVAGLRGLGLPPEIPASLIGRRPDLTAARWRAQAASDTIDEARADFYPNVKLIGVIGLQSLGVGNIFRGGADLGQVGPAIDLPIFDGGRRKARYRGARADYDAAVAAYDGALNAAIEEVADAVTSQRALDGRLADSRAALIASTDGWRLAQRRYTTGAADYQSVLIAEDRMLGNQRVVAGLEARRFVLDVALVKALGGGWQS
jgi:NodT family efflux transporter outer membrane factor (OMF) lipoprotein